MSAKFSSGRSGFGGDFFDLLHRFFDKLRLHEQKKLRVFSGQTLDEPLGDKAGKTRQKNCFAETHILI